MLAGLPAQVPARQIGSDHIEPVALEPCVHTDMASTQVATVVVKGFETHEDGSYHQSAINARNTSIKIIQFT